MKIDIFYVNCNPLRFWGPFTIQSLSITLQHLSGIFWEWTYCRQTMNTWLVVSNCKPRCLHKCTAMYVWRHSTSLPQVVGDRKVVPLAWQCVATDITICQRIFVSTSNHLIATCAILSRYVTLPFFLIPMTKRAPKGHHYTDERSFRRLWQNSSAAFQQVLCRSASKTSRNAGSSVSMQKEAISKTTLSTKE